MFKIKPQKQRFRHNPEQGSYGDCHRTCIAILLGIDAEEVPHEQKEWPNYGSFDKFYRDWLGDRGLVLVRIAFDVDLQSVLQTMEVMNPGLPYILGGRSKNDCNHSVVACEGFIICDPSLDNGGIVGPTEPDGHYWVEYLAMKVVL